MGKRRAWLRSSIGESRSVLDDLTRGHVTRMKQELPGAFLRLPVLLLLLIFSFSLLLTNEKIFGLFGKKAFKEIVTVYMETY